MDKKTVRFFIWSVVSIFFVCIVVFIWLTFFVGNKTKQAVNRTTNIYMSEMNTQIQQKFTSIINTRLQQVEGIIERTPPATQSYGKEMLDELAFSSRIRKFSYAGLYAHSGAMMKIDGDDIQLASKSELAEMIHSEGDIVTSALDSSGGKMLILGLPAEYPMKNGEKSEALLVGIPMSYLSEVLFLDEVGTLLYYHIITNDGEFLIRSDDAFRDNYFDRIRARYQEYEGRTPEMYVEELSYAMENREAYATVVSMNDGQQVYLFGSPLTENNNWYVIAAMPSNELAKPIAGLDRLRAVVMVASASVILLAMSVIFILYYRLSQQQMRELVKARNEADYSNAAKSNFLSSMSHEIRTPMNAIIGMTEIAQRNIHDPERVDDCLNKVRLSSKHLLGLINDVLDMSKIESKKMTLNIAPVSLRELLDDIVNIIQPQLKKKQLLFDIFIMDILSEGVYCDDMRLNQVLINILSNSVKYTNEGGKVFIYVHQEDSPKGVEYARTHFAVVDTGIGMSEDFQAHIWDTFSRENTDQVQHIIGTGLGMSITKSLVDLMDGTIELKSELGKGSMFHITLDLKMAEIVSDDKMHLPAWNILVVDNDEHLCSSAVSNLEALGVDAEWALSGEEAVKRVIERHGQGRDYDFVMVDWRMPDMDGIQTIQNIRGAVGKGLRIFLISAEDWSEVEESAKAASIEGFIGKPLFKSTLYDRFRKYADGYVEEETAGPEPEIAFADKRILVAEDMEINWEIANEILSDAGLILEHAENGKECVEMFLNSGIRYYDAILMDIRMPVMDGYEAAKQIRASSRPDKGLPIIAMTADAFEGDVQKCLEFGMDGHIPKPLDVGNCLRVLKQHLG